MTTPTPLDGNGHGTHVAGTIAAAENGRGVVGVAPQASIMPIRALDDSGRGSSADSAAGFAYAADHGAKIVNASIGSSDFSYAEMTAIRDHPGTLYVVAAGNDGRDTDAQPSYPCAYDLPNILCVGASDQSDRPASFSNHGAATVDLYAPGVAVLSTFKASSYAYMSGTSMATPHAAGAAALLLARAPSLAADALRRTLMDSADRVERARRALAYGRPPERGRRPGGAAAGHDRAGRAGGAEGDGRRGRDPARLGRQRGRGRRGLPRVRGRGQRAGRRAERLLRRDRRPAGRHRRALPGDRGRPRGQRIRGRDGGRADRGRAARAGGAGRAGGGRDTARRRAAVAGRRAARRLTRRRDAARRDGRGPATAPAATLAGVRIAGRIVACRRDCRPRTGRLVFTLGAAASVRVALARRSCQGGACRWRTTGTRTVRLAAGAQSLTAGASLAGMRLAAGAWRVSLRTPADAATVGFRVAAA